jgi:hypothetical protein
VILTTFQHDRGISYLIRRNPHGCVHRALFEEEDCGGRNCLAAQSCTHAIILTRTLRCYTCLRFDGNRPATGHVNTMQQTLRSTGVRVVVSPEVRAQPVRGAFERV